jgi:hypothetical protein
MGKNTGQSENHAPSRRKGLIMETASLTVIDETTELSSLEQLEMEFAKDRWDARNIPGLRYAAHTAITTSALQASQSGFALS